MTTATVLTHPEPPQSAFAKAGSVTTRILEYLAAIGIGIMLVVILWNVISRYFFGSPVQGTNELIGNIWLPIVVFIGYIVAVARGQAIEADIIYNMFPKQLKREVRFFTSLCAVVVCVLFGWYGFQEAVHAMNIGKTAPASDIYIAPVYWMVPFAFAGVSWLYLLDAIKAIRGKFDDAPELEIDALESELGGLKA